MSNTTPDTELCIGCVYYPPNLPATAYTEEDYRMLQARACSFDHHPGDEGCRGSRKTSCSLVDLEHMKQSVQNQEITP